MMPKTVGHRSIVSAYQIADPADCIWLLVQADFGLWLPVMPMTVGANRTPECVAKFLWNRGRQVVRHVFLQRRDPPCPGAPPRPPAFRIKGLSNYTLSRLGPRAHQHPAKEMRSWAVGFRSAGAYWIECSPKKIRRRARNVCAGGALFQTGALKFPATEFGQRPCQSLRCSPAEAAFSHSANVTKSSQPTTIALPASAKRK